MACRENIVEAYDDADSLHVELSAINTRHGRGDVVAIVWDKSKYAKRGVYVVQLQYGMRAYCFSIRNITRTGYTLDARGAVVRVVSDYFEGVCDEQV